MRGYKMIVINEKKVAKIDLDTKLKEARDYLTSTEWVESYLIKHYSGIEILPAESNKFLIEIERKKAISFIKENG